MIPQTDPHFTSGFYTGYAKAKADLRMLLAKAPENKQLGVVYAWLHEGGENGNA